MIQNSAISDVRVFPSRVDRWLVVLVAVPVGGAVVSTLVASCLTGPWPVALALAAFDVLFVWFLLALFRGTRYDVGGRELMVRSGPFRWRIPLAEIAEIRPSNNPLSSPALSLRRLEIRYGRGKSLLISPDDREGFLAEVAAREPLLVVSGDRLVRSV